MVSLQKDPGWKERVKVPVTFQPEGLQLGVVLGRELVVLQQPVQLLEVAPVEGDDRLRLQHGLVQLQLITLGQRPQEASQPLDLAALLEHLAHTGHLLLGEAEAGQGLPARRSVLGRRQHVSRAARVQTGRIVGATAAQGGGGTRGGGADEGGQLRLMGRRTGTLWVVVARNGGRRGGQVVEVVGRML